MVNVVTPFNSAQKLVISPKDHARIRRSLTLKAKVSLVVAAVLISLAVTVILVCFFWPSAKLSWMPEYESPSKLGKYESAAVSSDAAPCAAIGRDILQRNGSVIDAAIAVLACMGAVNPQSSGLGGGFLLLYYNRKERETYFLDARETAPRKATIDMFNGNATLAKVGGLAVAVPGELAGYYSAYNKYGTLQWKELFLPTIQMCKEGITVNKHLARALKKYEEVIKQHEHISNVFIDNSTGNVYEENDVIQRTDLAKTLTTISEEKVSALYGNTKLASEFLADLMSAGSIIDKTDMQKYLVKWRYPVSMELKDNMTLYSVSPPGSGALLAFMMGVLNGYKDMNPSVTRTKQETVKALHRILETFKFAYARRMDMEDDASNEMKQLVEHLTSPTYANEIRERIDDERTYDNPDHYGVNVTVQEDHGTAHVSIVGPNGDAVSATSTINLYFGSMILSPSTGIILNNEMDDFSSPNITNYFGVPPTRKNYIKPNKRPMSSMSPAIVVDTDGNARLVLGANGGTQITTSVAQVAVRNLWLGDDIKRSIDAPRFHHQLLPNYIEHEDLFPEDLLEDLRQMGHKTEHLGSGMIGIAMGIARGEDGYLYANSDYRKRGNVEGF